MPLRPFNVWATLTRMGRGGQLAGFELFYVRTPDAAGWTPFHVRRPDVSGFESLQVTTDG
jgi:hypothetical protein